MKIIGETIDGQMAFNTENAEPIDTCSTKLEKLFRYRSRGNIYYLTQDRTNSWKVLFTTQSAVEWCINRDIPVQNIVDEFNIPEV